MHFKSSKEQKKAVIFFPISKKIPRRNFSFGGRSFFMQYVMNKSTTQTFEIEILCGIRFSDFALFACYYRFSAKSAFKSGMNNSKDNDNNKYKKIRFFRSILII